MNFHLSAIDFCDSTSSNNMKISNFFFQKFVKSNQTIQLKETVDPTIIGGLVASIGDKYVDMSVATKIKKYTDLIQATA